MTAAALGSRLSLAGTVVGAAFASIIAAVGGALYTASLRRTSRHVNAVLTRVRPTAPGGASGPQQGPTLSDPTGTDPAVRRTSVDPVPEWTLSPEREQRTAATTVVPPGRSRIGWKKVLVAALLMFVIAALALTGLELATGRALSGGSGTTVGQVAEPSTRPTPKPTGSATATATPSERPTATPSATASATARPSTAPSSTPSSEPTARPSTSSSPTPTETPTASSSAVPSAGPSGATPAS